MSERARVGSALLRLAARALAFAVAFTFEVRVRAESPVAERPAGCLKMASSSACAVSATLSSHLAFPLAADGEALLFPGAAIARETEGRAVLVAGGARVRAGGRQVEVVVEFGSVFVESGEAWIHREGERVWVDAVEGSVSMKPRGSQVVIAVDAGATNWLGPIGIRGVASSGYPRPLDLDAVLKRAAKVHKGTRAEFEADAERWTSLWRESVRSIASQDEDRARARRAQLIEEERRRAAQAAAREADRRSVRALFRAKTLE